MKKKLLGLLLAVTTAVSMTACTGGADAPATDGGNGTGEDTGVSSAASDVKIGVILVGDENEGYSYAHIDGIRKAAEAVGIPAENIIISEIYSPLFQVRLKTSSRNFVRQGNKVQAGCRPANFVDAV